MFPLLLASQTDGGLRLIRTGSGVTLPVSRLARHSIFILACVLVDPVTAGSFTPEGFVLCRCQQLTLWLLPAGAAVAGWVIFLPLEERVLFTSHSDEGVSMRGPSVDQIPRGPIFISKNSVLIVRAFLA